LHAAIAAENAVELNTVSGIVFCGPKKRAQTGGYLLLAFSEQIGGLLSV
jgi:hypothetical protein